MLALVREDINEGISLEVSEAREEEDRGAMNDDGEGSRREIQPL